MFTWKWRTTVHVHLFQSHLKQCSIQCSLKPENTGWGYKRLIWSLLTFWVLHCTEFSLKIINILSFKVYLCTVHWPEVRTCKFFHQFVNLKHGKLNAEGQDEILYVSKWIYCLSLQFKTCHQHQLSRHQWWHPVTSCSAQWTQVRLGENCCPFRQTLRLYVDLILGLYMKPLFCRV